LDIPAIPLAATAAATASLMEEEEEEESSGCGSSRQAKDALRFREVVLFSFIVTTTTAVEAPWDYPKNTLFL
jgi:hypothetical protein